MYIFGTSTLKVVFVRFFSFFEFVACTFSLKIELEGYLDLALAQLFRSEFSRLLAEKNKIIVHGTRVSLIC